MFTLLEYRSVVNIISGWYAGSCRFMRLLVRSLHPVASLLRNLLRFEPLRSLNDPCASKEPCATTGTSRSPPLIIKPQIIKPLGLVSCESICYRGYSARAASRLERELNHGMDTNHLQDASIIACQPWSRVLYRSNCLTK